MIPQTAWQWFGSAGHFICGFDCRWHLCTLVGDILISSVGEYFPDYAVREILAKSRGFDLGLKKGDERKAAFLNEFGYEDIGSGRKFETMAFRVSGKVCEAPECGCGLPEIIPSELTSRGSNDAKTATAHHYEVCFLASEGRVEENEYGYEELVSSESQPDESRRSVDG